MALLDAAVGPYGDRMLVERAPWLRPELARSPGAQSMHSMRRLLFDLSSFGKSMLTMEVVSSSMQIVCPNRLTWDSLQSIGASYDKN